MRITGHRNIKNSRIYTHLIDFEGDEYHSAIAKTTEEESKMIETGFEYLCTNQDIMLFRKRIASVELCDNAEFNKVNSIKAIAAY